jgi:hypothetical protein
VSCEAQRACAFFTSALTAVTFAYLYVFASGLIGSLLLQVRVCYMKLEVLGRLREGCGYKFHLEGPRLERVVRHNVRVCVRTAVTFAYLYVFASGLIGSLLLQVCVCVGGGCVWGD